MANNVPQTPPTGFLVDIIPVKQRKRVYALYSLAGLVVGAVFLAVVAIFNQEIPLWALIMVLVYNFLGPFFGALAGSNARPTGEEAAELP